MTTEELLFRLLKNEICGTKLPMDFDVTGKEKDLYRLSKRHDLAHLIGDALLRNNLLPRGKAADAFKRHIIMAVYRYEQQNAMFQTVCNAFNEAEIAYIPLKGIITRDYYPEPWMRTSCDVDILIHESDVDNATKVLIENGFETDYKRDVRHISFYLEDLHLELHFNIFESNKRMNQILKNIWGNAEKSDKFQYRENPEFFVLHHIVHMARHFLSGGCGVRPFIDLWLLKSKNSYDEDKLIPLLEACNVLKFYQCVCQLINVWMNDAKHDALSIQMEKYVLSGGVYGSAANQNAVGVAMNKGKLRYLFKTAFLPYSNMCIIYPILIKHKLLLPFCYIHRMITKILGKDRKRTKGRINSTMAQETERIKFISELLDQVGLYKR